MSEGMPESVREPGTRKAGATDFPALACSAKTNKVWAMSRLWLTDLIQLLYDLCRQFQLRAG